MKILLITLLFLIATVLPVKAIHEDNTHYVVQELTDWESVAELMDFLEADDTSEFIVFIEKATFEGQCEDYAMQLRDRATAKGRYLSLDVLTPSEYRHWYQEKGDYHMINSAIIGNEVWYIEPSDDRIWHALNLD